LADDRMTQYRFVRWMHLSDEHGLYVRPETEGSLVIVDVDEVKVRVRVPAFDETWSEERVISGRAGDPADMDVLLQLVEASVDFEATPDADGRPPANAMSRAYTACSDAVAALRRTLRLDQPWIGLGDTEPEQIGSTYLVDLETGRRLPGYGVMRSRVIADAKGLDAVSLQAAGETASSEEPVPTPESLLADARFLASYRRPPDPQKGVLVAAIACEVKAQQRLRMLARPDAAPVLDLLLDNPRAFPHAALELFDQVPLAIVGRSLRSDDKELFKQVQKLFEERNAVAHRGETPAVRDAQQLVSSVGRVFVWFEELRGPE
jgi:hypothetical protein